MANPVLVPRAHRIVNDDGTITTATFGSTENGTYSFSVPQRFRVRGQLDETADKANTAGVSWQMRYRESSTAGWGGWGNVDGDIALAASTNVAAGTAITTQRLSNAPAGTFEGELHFVSSTTGQAESWNFDKGGYTESECCVAATTAFTSGQQAQFRLWPASYGTTSGIGVVTVTSLGSTGAQAVMVTVDLDSALERQRILRTASADAGVQRAGLIFQQALDGVVATRHTLQAELDALVRALVALTVGLDARLDAGAVTYTNTTDLAATIRKRVFVGIKADSSVITADDAINTADYRGGTPLDAVLALRSVRTGSADAAILGTGVVTASLDAPLSALEQAQAAIDAALMVPGARTASADAAVSATGSVVTFLDAPLSALQQAQVAMDAALERLEQRSASIDARLISLGMPVLAVDLDAALRATVSAAVALGAAVSATTDAAVQADAAISAGRTLAANLDAASAARLALQLDADAAFRRAGIYGVADVDATLLGTLSLAADIDARINSGSAVAAALPPRDAWLEVPARRRVVRVR